MAVQDTVCVLNNMVFALLGKIIPYVHVMPSRDLKSAVILSLLYEVRYTAWVLIFTLLIHK